jgi:transposase
MKKDKLDKLTTAARLRENGMKWKDIATSLGCNADSLRGKYHHWKRMQDLPPKLKIKRRKTDGSIGVKIKEIAMQTPRVAYRDFHKILEDAGYHKNAIPSYGTIRRFLKSNEYSIKKLRKKMGISKVNIQKRAEWCRIMAEKPAEYWDTVIWSDETVVRQAPKGKDILVYAHRSQKLKDLGVNSQLHSGGFSVMFWGCFSKVGLGPLVVIEGTMTAQKYIETLRNKLLPELQAAGRPMIFMQDNAPCHKATSVMDFLSHNKVNVMSWPAQSPDLNPIENLWAIIKARRQKQFGVPKNKMELIEQTLGIWEEITETERIKLADSAIKRVREVLKLKGKLSNH